MYYHQPKNTYISMLNSSLEAVSSRLTLQVEPTVKDTLTSQKVGNIVSFSGYLWTGSSTPKTTIIMTVPHKAIALTMLCAIELTKQAYPVQVMIDTNGNMRTGDQALPAGTWGIIGFYITEDN